MAPGDLGLSSLDSPAQGAAAAGRPLSWKIGSCGPTGEDGVRLPSTVWCALGLFEHEADARRAFEHPQQFLPFLPQAVEAWHGLLLPVGNRGQSNLLNPFEPGPLFTVSKADPGGECLVMTTAGFILGLDEDRERIRSFRKSVDETNQWIQKAKGLLASLVFAPHTPGDDGITLSLWQTDAAMFEAAYQPGAHRKQVDKQKANFLCDRTSFSRFRVFASTGLWDGKNPLTPPQI
jgi:hypothetical protein